MGASGARAGPGWWGAAYHLEGALQLGHSVPGLELVVLHVAQGVLESPLAPARGQVAKPDEVAPLVHCEYLGPQLGGRQLGWGEERGDSARPQA